MSATIPLPETIRNKTRHNTHPGLELDKYAASYLIAEADKLQELVQKPTIEKVVKLSQAPPDQAAFDSLRQRREAMLAGLEAERFFCTTTGPLTLHLARASALENAGICLHHIYGFAYLPGSGLKGMARAFAETVWLPAIETNKAAAEKKILAVFGNKPQVKPFECGKIVFHDAWPQQWPKLFIDIVNNHHPDYYSLKDAPGDWENPIPVYFMAVTSGGTFSFALSHRREGADSDLLKLACEWLLGALCHMGAGAKTNAGYGNFMPVEGPKPSLPQVTRRVFETEVELVTPAFLAGASQDQSDCDLRSATLRGLLRWWWRTMHSAHTDVDSLRNIEALVWGDTQTSGAVRITVSGNGLQTPQLFDYKDKYKLKPDFKNDHDIQHSPGGKTTQGLFYISYGMDDAGKKSEEGKGKRWYLAPKNRWSVNLTAKAVKTDGTLIDADLLLSQAKGAFWLLCNYGGLGAKGGKGFGSLQANIPGMDLEKCKSSAMELRQKLFLREKIDKTPLSAAVEDIVAKNIQTPWKDSWFVLDQLGFAIQAFAQKYKHREEKLALGLPRKIHGPRRDPMNNQGKDHKPPRNLSVMRGRQEINRHTSPVHIHFYKGNDGSLSIQIAAFPSAVLPDYEQSRSFLKDYVSFLETELSSRAKKYNSIGQKDTATLSAAIAGVGFVGRQSGAVALPKAGDLVAVEIVEDPKGKGRLFAKHQAFEKPGAVLNPDKFNGDKSIGAKAKLEVAMVSANGRDIQFRPAN